jgi:hypothetical protein
MKKKKKKKKKEKCRDILDHQGVYRGTSPIRKRTLLGPYRSLCVRS